MKPNIRIALILAAFLTSLLAVLAVIFTMVGRNPSAPPASAIGGPFELVDATGRTVTDKDLKGKPFLVFFGFTHCPDICPTTLFEASEVMRVLGKDAERTAALFITVDPERDTQEAMKTYLQSFHPAVVGLTGAPDKIAAAEKAYRVYSKKVPTQGADYTMDHTALVYLMDKQGRFVAPFNLKRRPEESAADLRKYF